MTGSARQQGSNDDNLYFVKTDSEGNASLNVTDISNITRGFIVYPVPATTSITLLYDHLVSHPEIQIYNSLGKMIYDEYDQKEIDIELFSEGIYLISIIGNDKIYSQRFSKM